MTVAVNRIIIYFSILLICIGHTAGKCPENMLDCCGNCYNPGSEECIKSGYIDCKIVEKSNIRNSTFESSAPRGQR